MDKEEARAILDGEVSSFRRKPYAHLAAMVGEEPVTGERRGPSGQVYQIEIEAIWDDSPGGNVRILASIDDGGWSAFRPLTVDFVKCPSDEGDDPSEPE